ncbi:MAG: hypothetical protein JNK32_07600 [Anaerolineales bacterium]|nr:hypothetical protein [Anaerolineales bacterium]
MKYAGGKVADSTIGFIALGSLQNDSRTANGLLALAGNEKLERLLRYFSYEALKKLLS